MYTLKRNKSKKATHSVLTKPMNSFFTRSFHRDCVLGHSANAEARRYSSWKTSRESQSSPLRFGFFVENTVRKILHVLCSKVLIQIEFQFQIWILIRYRHQCAVACQGFEELGECDGKGSYPFLPSSVVFSRL